MTGGAAPDVELAPHLVVLASVLVPMLLATALWVTRIPAKRIERGAIALATLWNAVWLLALNVLAVRVGWWSFGDAGPTLVGVPVALWLGWAVLWGPVAAQSPLRPSLTLLALAIIDLVYMPLGGEAVQLHDSWLAGEAVGLALVAWPGILLARWSATGTRLRGRAVLQTAMFVGLLAWVIPATATSLVGRNLQLDVPHVAYGAVLVAIVAAGLPGLIAVHEFFLAGGTPWPWEATERPVRSGPYRYLRSPMQASGTLLLFVMAFVYGEPVVGLAALSAVLYSRLFCSMEADELAERFGPAWSELALAQRRWIPSVRPSESGEPATVWVNLGCEVCNPIAEFLRSRDAQGLTIRDAAGHEAELVRIRYERRDGVSFDGVAAVGACLEHVHVGWAMIGWMLRLPLVVKWWQLIGDAVGFGPRPAVPGTTPEAGTRPQVVTSEVS